MTDITIEQLYQQHIKPIPVTEQWRLIALIGEQLAIKTAPAEQRSLLELEGLGIEIKTMYIFLDIDGVLVKKEAPGTEIDSDEDLMKFDDNCLTWFENVVNKYYHSQ